MAGAGAGGDAYDKFQTAISAGSSAPDVKMVEADPQFAGVIVPASDVEGYRSLLHGTPIADRIFGVGSAKEILDAIAILDGLL